MITLSNVSCVILMIREFNISIAQTTWLYSAESASRKTTPTKDALSWTSTKSKRCGKCTDSTSKWTRSNSKRGKTSLASAVSLRKFQMTKCRVTPSGSRREKRPSWPNRLSKRSSRCSSSNSSNSFLSSRWLPTVWTLMLSRTLRCLWQWAPQCYRTWATD